MNYSYFPRVKLMFIIFPSVPVVEECVKQLEAGGFTELKEKDVWKVKPLGKVNEY